MHVELTTVPTRAGFWVPWMPFALPGQVIFEETAANAFNQGCYNAQQPGQSCTIYQVKPPVAKHGYRDYDPLVGRFLQADPITGWLPVARPQVYEYVRNNPTQHTDPLGLFVCIPSDPSRRHTCICP